MRNLYVYCVLLFVLSKLSGCQSMDVHVVQDKQFSIKDIKTVAWHSKGNTLVGVSRQFSGKGHHFIRGTIERQLKAHGISIVPPSNPDALIAYHLGVVDKSEVTKWGYIDKIGTRHAVAIESHPYRKGTLYIDLINPKTGYLYSRGIAVGTKDDNDSGASLRGRVEKGIEQIFKQLK